MSAPIVYSYYQPVEGMPNPQALLNLWALSWEKQGWKTALLNENDAREHPGYAYFNERISRFPTSNPREYERACFLRHLAMANLCNANVDTLVDYDVINQSWTAERSWVGPISEMAFMEVLEPTRVPCAIRGNREGFENLCDALCEYLPGDSDNHVSDMTIIRQLPLYVRAVCVEHLNSGSSVPDEAGDGWKTAPLVHFSNYSFHKLGWKGDKADLIKRVLATL